MRLPDDIAPGCRRVGLPDGRTLIVRPAEAADIESLTLLYSGLSTDDLHLRFFAVYHPPRRFFEHLAAASTEGGYVLVAIVDDPVARIVAEADFFPLDNGNGELAVTVAAEWRGWLGPYLLDALIEAAAARGVPNLEAEILVENRRMLALIRHRGYATVDGSDFTTVRVSVGTATPTPTWAGPHDRPRVLAEVAGGRWGRERVVREAGLQVMVCPGPQSGSVAHCPAVDGRPCPLAEGADVIVCSLPVGRGHGAEVRASHRSVLPGTPVLVEGQAAAPGEQTMNPHMSDDALVALLEQALINRARSGSRQER